MIAIIVPVHNEEQTLGRCLHALQVAAAFPLLEMLEVKIIVVLDSCTDNSQEIAAGFAVSTIEVQVSNVGAARAAGASFGIASGADWLANTDADTVVAPDWLWQQLQLKAEVVCGTIGVDDWSDHGVSAIRLHQHFLHTYTDADGHSHIHGANFGVSALAYQKAGGFKALSCSEDVALVQALQEAGAVIAWTAAPRVVTSARTRSRAPGGFGDTLKMVVSQFD